MIEATREFCDLQILIPVFNDWESIGLLLPILDQELEKAGLAADLFFVDDGSPSCELHVQESYRCVKSVRILDLHHNLGHQRAICVGLCYLREHSQCEEVLIMDGDGEDLPEDIDRLRQALRGSPDVRIAFAERLKRSEGSVFAMGYFGYRLMHQILVGHKVRVGNFSIMSRRCLECICTSAALWNHFAAAVFASRQKMTLVPTRRGTRLAGKPKMNMPALVTHGLSALSVFSDRIGTRLSIASFLALSGIAILLLTFAIVGTAELNATLYLLLAILSLGLTQFVALISMFSFLILSTRGLGQFIPIRDYHHFVRNLRTI